MGYVLPEYTYAAPSLFCFVFCRSMRTSGERLLFFLFFLPTSGQAMPGFYCCLVLACPVSCSEALRVHRTRTGLPDKAIRKCYSSMIPRTATCETNSVSRRIRSTVVQQSRPLVALQGYFRDTPSCRSFCSEILSLSCFKKCSRT